MTPPSIATSSSPKVYLNYTQDELDTAYTQAAWAPNMKDVLARQSEASAKLRSVLAPRTFSYGAGQDETLDVFTSGTMKGPIHVHIHGGGWRALTKDDVSFPRRFSPRRAPSMSLSISR